MVVNNVWIDILDNSAQFLEKRKRTPKQRLNPGPFAKEMDVHTAARKNGRSAPSVLLWSSRDEVNLHILLIKSFADRGYASGSPAVVGACAGEHMKNSHCVPVSNWS